MKKELFTCTEAVFIAANALTYNDAIANCNKKPKNYFANMPYQTAQTVCENVCLEDPDENEKIIAALEQQGYFRQDVPLSYEMQDFLHTDCERCGIDYHVVLGLIEIESNFQSDAINPRTGCYGLCQLNPAYFPSDLSPAENMSAGVELLRQHLDKYGSIEAALTAYRHGHDNGNRNYAAAVLRAAEKWRNDA